MLGRINAQRFLERTLPVAAVVGTVTFLPAIWLTSGQFSAYATAIQAFAVLLALVFAARSISSEVRDRRLDRVLTLHSTFMEGELGAARYRFIRHLRSNRNPQGLITRITRDPDLMDGQPLAEYPATYAAAFRGYHPRQDANLVVRHFERVESARVAESIDENLLFRLLGPQVVWWDNALEWERARRGTWALHRLADWARQYVIDHPELTDPWGEWEWDIESDFGHTAGTPLPR
jgi:hypothetical protein